MKLVRFAGAAGTAAGLTMALAGVASAADNVNINTTGPGSTQSVVINNSTQVSTSNTNVVHVSNENVQIAKTGDVQAGKNTSVSGSLNSGTASNANTVTTNVIVTNQPVGGLGNVPEVKTPPTSSNGGTQANNQTTGSVLGASTTGGRGAGAGQDMLPKVGASIPMDVSALRAAWQPQAEVPTTSVVKQAQGVTALMLAVAAMLSLLGALGSIVYARRKEGNV